MYISLCFSFVTHTIHFFLNVDLTSLEKKKKECIVCVTNEKQTSIGHLIYLSLSVSMFLKWCAYISVLSVDGM